MIDWVLNLIPWWVWLVAIFVAIGATYSLWAPFWAIVPRPVKAAIVGVVAIVGTWFVSERRAIQRERERQREAGRKAEAARKEVEDEVRSMPDADRDRELRRWMRD